MKTSALLNYTSHTHGTGALNRLQIFSLCTATLLTYNTSAHQSHKQPNILWISTEDMSPHLGCYGDKVTNTPNIDRLASQGIRFDNVFTTAAISAPVRAGIITGMYQTSIGCMHMRTTSYRRSVDNPVEFTAVPLLPDTWCITRLYIRRCWETSLALIQWPIASEKGNSQHTC